MLFVFLARCSAYSSGHAFHSFLINQCAFGAILILLAYPLFAAISLNLGVFPLFRNFLVYCIVLFCSIGSHISMQFSSPLTCRPIEVLYDVRFISILIVQLSSYVGCLLFAYKLGYIFWNNRSKIISPNKTSFSQSYVIDMK